jgi:hypothetical protein
MIAGAFYAMRKGVSLLGAYTETISQGSARDLS